MLPHDGYQKKGLSMASRSTVATILATLMSLACADAAQAYYHPGTGRFISRDPIGIADGPNEYWYVRNQVTISIDPFGLWKIERKSQRRALAISETGDTVNGLAHEIYLEPDEYDLWLHPAPSALPATKETRLCGGCKYTIPNTVSVVWGQLRGTDAWWYPMSVWYKFWVELRAERNGFRRLGFLVIEDNAPPAWAVEDRLRDPDLIAFFYAGHATVPNGDLAPRVPIEDSNGRRINDTVPQMLYRRRSDGLHKIAFMKLLGCTTARAGADDVRLGIQTATWPTNVSSLGSFVGFYGSPSFWDDGDYMELPGTGGLRGD